MILRNAKGTDVKVTLEQDTKVKDEQHIVIDIPSTKSLVQIMKAIDYDLVIEQEFPLETPKYPVLCIYDDYIE